MLLAPKSNDHAWIGGFFLGILAWCKNEGLVLAAVAAIVCAGVALGTSRRSAAKILIATASLAVGAIVFRHVYLPAGVSFFSGDWTGRAMSRMTTPGEIVQPMIRDLLDRDWLLLWPLALVGVAIGAHRSDRIAVSVSLVVATQIAVYGCVYFASYLSPQDHILSSFHRIVSALAPATTFAFTNLFIANDDRFVSIRS